MSVFNDVPDPNPFDADISTRPAIFTLHPERADRYIIGFIALFWLVAGPLLTVLIVALLISIVGLTEYLRPVIVVSAVIAVGVYIWWWWPEFKASFRVVKVTIWDESVDVHERDLLSNRSWSHPLSEFKGVAMVSLGTRLVGFSKVPMAAVMLVHPDPSRSIPLSISGTNRLGRPNVAQKARQLGLPVLAGVATGNAGKVYPEDVIVVNRYQALKMRLIQAGFALAMLFFAGGAFRQYGTADADIVWPAMAGILALVVIAMHMFARQYVIEMRDRGGEIALRTGAILLPWRRFPQHRILGLDHHEGRMTTIRQSVHTPYMKMRVDRYTWPFIIDMQSDFVDEGRLRGLANRSRPRAPGKRERRR